MASSVMNKPEMKDFFTENFKHDLVNMSKDTVANVRLALARVLRNHFKQMDGTFIYDAKINQALATLAADQEVDVRSVVAQIKDLFGGVHDDASSESSQHSSRQANTTVEEVTQAHEVNEFVQGLSKPAEGNLELSMGSVGDVSINSETSKANIPEEDDNEPVDMQALLDKDNKEVLFGHLESATNQSAPFREMSESEYVPKTE
jgi:hypothetical protein